MQQFKMHTLKLSRFSIENAVQSQVPIAQEVSKTIKNGQK